MEKVACTVLKRTILKHVLFLKEHFLNFRKTKISVLFIVVKASESRTT